MNLAVREMPINGFRGDSLLQVRIDRGEACASMAMKNLQQLRFAGRVVPLTEPAVAQ
jgi:hypothetical protein